MPVVDNTHTPRNEAKWLKVQDLRDLYDGRPYAQAGNMLSKLQDNQMTPAGAVREIKKIKSFNERMALCMLLADSLGQCDMRDVMAALIRAYVEG